MIKFNCKHCDHPIKVSGQHVGKKGKCPQCHGILIVPVKHSESHGSPIIKFKCPHCEHKISVKAEYAGKRAHCAKCKHSLQVPEQTGINSAPLQLKKTVEQVPAADNGITPEDLFTSQEALDNLLAAEQDAPALKLAPIQEPQEASESVYADSPLADTPTYKNEEKGKRSLPWPIDILLYPVSLGALISISIFIIGPILAPLSCCLGGILNIPLSIYISWYFCECIRDSADGGLRAPEIAGWQDSFAGMVLQLIRILFCYLIYLYAFVMLYQGYLLLSNTVANPIIIGVLLALGGFLFPMAILAVSVLESFKGLNPILIIRSVAGTFLPYCGLVLLFYGLIITYILLIAGTSLASLPISSIGSIITLFILRRLIFIWAMLVAAHILGRFYWRYWERMNW